MKTILSSIMMLTIIVSGLWLHSKGRPLSQILFTIHKLLVIATAIFTIINFNKFLKIENLGQFNRNIIVFTSLIFLFVFITGAFLSFDKMANPVLKILHKISPYFLMVAIIYCFYLFRK